LADKYRLNYQPAEGLSNSIGQSLSEIDKLQLPPDVARARTRTTKAFRALQNWHWDVADWLMGKWESNQDMIGYATDPASRGMLRETINAGLQRIAREADKSVPQEAIDALKAFIAAVNQHEAMAAVSYLSIDGKVDQDQVDELRTLITATAPSLVCRTFAAMQVGSPERKLWARAGRPPMQAVVDGGVFKYLKERAGRVISQETAKSEVAAASKAITLMDADDQGARPEWIDLAKEAVTNLTSILGQLAGGSIQYVPTAQSAASYGGNAAVPDPFKLDPNWATRMLKPVDSATFPPQLPGWSRPLERRGEFTRRSSKNEGLPWMELLVPDAVRALYTPPKRDVTTDQNNHTAKPFVEHVVKPRPGGPATATRSYEFSAPANPGAGADDINDTDPIGKS
jgi:hypothetical protein